MQGFNRLFLIFATFTYLCREQRKTRWLKSTENRSGWSCISKSAAAITTTGTLKPSVTTGTRMPSGSGTPIFATTASAKKNPSGMRSALSGREYWFQVFGCGECRALFRLRTAPGITIPPVPVIFCRGGCSLPRRGFHDSSAWSNDISPSGSSGR